MENRHESIGRFLPQTVKTNRVTVSGNKRTKLSFFQDELNHEIAAAKTVDELCNNLTRVTDRISQMDIFEDVDTTVNIESISKGVYNAHVKMHVTEKNIPYLKASTFARYGELSNGSNFGVELQATARNPFGFGENFCLLSNTSVTGSKELVSTLNIPNISKDQGNLKFMMKSGQEEKSYFTSFNQQATSMLAEYTSRNRAHQLTAEYSLRDEYPYDPLEFMTQAEEFKALSSPNEKEAGSFSYDNVFNIDFSPPRFTQLFSTIKPPKGKGTTNARSPNIVEMNSNPYRNKPVQGLSVDTARSKRSDISAARSKTTNAAGANYHTANPNYNPKATNAGVGLGPGGISSSMKSSIRYLYTVVDTRGNARSPVSGHLLQGALEVAGSPGSAHFLRGDMSSQIHHSLTPPLFGQEAGVVASLCCNVGFMYPLTRPLSSGQINAGVGVKDKRKTLYRSFLSDRFQLGSSLTLNGFDVHSLEHRNKSAYSEDKDNSDIDMDSNGDVMGKGSSVRGGGGGGGSGRGSSSSSGGGSRSSDWRHQSPNSGGQSVLSNRSSNVLRSSTNSSSAMAMYSRGGGGDMGGVRGAQTGPNGSSSSFQVPNACTGDTSNNSNSPPKNPLVQQPMGAGDSLGGDARSSLFLSLSTPLPFLKSRGFVFMNAGSLGNSDYWKVATFPSVREKMESPMLTPNKKIRASEGDILSTKSRVIELQSKYVPLFGYLRASVGGGFSVAVAESIRMEATYSVPLIKDKYDNVGNCQLGLGLTIN